MDATGKENATLPSPSLALRDELVKALWTCAPAMAAKVLRSAPSTADAEDIQSAGIVAVLQQIPGMMAHTQSIRNMHAYGLGVMRNAMRKEANSHFRDKLSAPIEDRASDENTESRLIENERHERAEAALIAMPEQATVLRSRYADSGRGKISRTTYRREQKALEVIQRVAA